MMKYGDNRRSVHITDVGYEFILTDIHIQVPKIIHSFLICYKLDYNKH